MNELLLIYNRITTFTLLSSKATHVEKTQTSVPTNSDPTCEDKHSTMRRDGACDRFKYCLCDNGDSTGSVFRAWNTAHENRLWETAAAEAKDSGMRQT